MTEPLDIERLERALAASREARDRHSEARMLKELAVLHHNSGDAAKAAELIEAALPIAREVRDPDLEARLSNNLGLALQDLQGGQSGRAAFDRSLEIAQKHGNEAVEAIALGNLADLDLARNDARAALPRLVRAAVLARKLGNPGLAARVLGTLAEVHHTLGNPKEAVRLYEEAVPHARASGQPLGEAHVRNALGMELLNTGQPDRAIEEHQKALAMAREAKDLETEAAALTGLAMAYEELKDPAREAEAARRLRQIAGELKNEIYLKAAERHLQGSRERESGEPESVRLRQEIGAALDRQDHAAAASLSYQLGLHLMGQMDVHGSVEAFDQALVLSRGAEDPILRLSAFNAMIKISDLAAEHPKVPEFLDHLEQAASELQLGEEAQGMLLIRRGLVRIEAEDPQGAIPLLQRGLSLVSGRDLPEEVRLALGSLAFCEGLLGHLVARVSYAERLLAEARKANDHLGVGEALHELASAAGDQGDLPRAIDLAEQSLAALARSGTAEADQRRIHVLSFLGTAHLNTGDPDGALRAYREMQKLGRESGDRKAEAIALQLQAGVVLLEGGKKGDAEALVAESLVLGSGLDDPDIELQALSLLGLVAAREGDHRKAIDTWQKVLEVLGRPSSRPFDKLNQRLDVIALGFLASAHADLNEPVRALELADSALESAERLAGDRFEPALALDARAYVHYRAGRLAQAESDARSAMDRFEAIRARLGKAELAKAGALDQQSSLYELQQQIQIGLGKPVEALLTAELARARAFAESLGDDRPLTAEGLKRIAAELGATLVEYSVLYVPTRALLPGRLAGEGLQEDLESALYIWVVRPDGQVTHRSVNLAEVRAKSGTLRQKARELLDHLNADGERQAEIRSGLRDLHDLLVAPVADLLPEDAESSVVLIPHGALFLVPFPALLDPQGRHLVEKHTLLTVPSIKSLDLLKGRPAEQGLGGALVVGNPKTLWGEPLSEAETEAREIASRLGARALVGAQATVTAVVQGMRGARLIHLASHGRRGDKERPAALALAPSEPGEDGLLTSDEIRTLDLEADLVVLSACQSGVGRISGDGVMGLPRSFLAAGAAGVVMSLWRIYDKAAADLMIDFHRRLATADPARALRQAMLAAIDRGEGPSSWGAFSYVGAPRAAPARLSAP